MKNGLHVKNGILIPDHELEITTSRAGGPGGQHVNKTDTRITVRWNVKNTQALNDIQKECVLQKLQAQLTNEGDLIVHNSASRSQLKNKEMALSQLAQIISKALIIPKKRMATTISKATKAARLEKKARHGAIKKMRSKKFQHE